MRARQSQERRVAAVDTTYTSSPFEEEGGGTLRARDLRVPIARDANFAHVTGEWRGSTINKLAQKR